jgi:SagB-type dehydrogenase family enzyme
VPADGAAVFIEAYEHQMTLRPPALRWANGTSASQSQRLMALQQERYTIEYTPRHELPDCDVTLSQGRFGEITEGSIARILRGVAGTRTDNAREKIGGVFQHRWCPTGGNLGSVEIYVAADQSLFGLPGTIFHYDDVAHQLISVSRNHTPINHLLRNTDLTTVPGDLVFLMVGAIKRISQKYDEFGLRLAHLDAGCAALQLTLLAEDCGLSLSFASTWDQDIERMLELYPGYEVVTAIARLSARGNVRPSGGR